MIAIEPIITHASNEPHGYKLCKCSECGVVRHCVPEFDFYVREGQPDNGPLVCEACLIKGVTTKPTIVIGGNHAN